MGLQTIHILRHGYPLCAFSDEVPRDWQEGHKWVGLEDRVMANCARCLAVLSRVPPPEVIPERILEESKMQAAKLIIEVMAGVAPGDPLPEYTKRWGWTSADQELLEAGDAEA